MAAYTSDDWTRLLNERDAFHNAKLAQARAETAQVKAEATELRARLRAFAMFGSESKAQPPKKETSSATKNAGYVLLNEQVADTNLNVNADATLPQCEVESPGRAARLIRRELAACVAEHAAESEQMRTKIAMLEREVADKRGQLLAVEQRLQQSTTDQLAEARAEAAVAKQEIVSLRQAVAVANGRFDQLVGEHAALVSAAEVQKRAAEVASKTCEALRKDLTGTSQDLSHTRSALATCAAQSAAESEQMLTNIAALEKELADKVRQLLSLKEVETAAREAKDAALASMQQQLADRTEQLRGATAALEAKEAEFAGQQRVLAVQVERAESVGLRKAELEAEVSRLSGLAVLWLVSCGACLHPMGCRLAPRGRHGPW
jgi:hypothetical protein